MYGSLGAVIAFLFFMYISANTLLIGGEVAKAQAEARLPETTLNQSALPGLRPGISGRLLGMVKGLFVSH